MPIAVPTATVLAWKEAEREIVLSYHRSNNDKSSREKNDL